MRIIAGTLKSRRLATPDFEGLRPTSDRLRETLFNVIAGRIPGANVLDGFAGTGALGIEAISRGAAHVTFVDDDRRAVALISENVRRCGVAERCVIIRGRLIEVSPRLEMAPFDLILLDPPYAASDAGQRGPRERAASWGQGPHDPNDAASDAGQRPNGTGLHAQHEDLADVLNAAAFALTDDGLVVLEHARRRHVPESAGELVRTRSLTSGDSVLAFYQRRARQPDSRDGRSNETAHAQ
jgi:16S rRNA G966 N2-methylase RsmD